MTTHGSIIIKKQFAWIPVLIRNRGMWGIDSKWVWLKRYTRVKRYNENLMRFRTIETVLGWHDVKEEK